MKIRRMIDTDIPEVLKMARTVHAESSYNKLAFDEGKVFMLAQSALSHPSIVVFIAESEDREIAGLYGAYTSQHCFSSEPISMDYLFYVKPQFRHTSAVLNLVFEYIKWAKEKGVKNIMAGVTAEINDSGAIKIYEHCGFWQAGTLMRRDVL